MLPERWIQFGWPNSNIHICNEMYIRCVENKWITRDWCWSLNVETSMSIDRNGSIVPWWISLEDNAILCVVQDLSWRRYYVITCVGTSTRRLVRHCSYNEKNRQQMVMVNVRHHRLQRYTNCILIWGRVWPHPNTRVDVRDALVSIEPNRAKIWMDIQTLSLRFFEPLPINEHLP